MIKKRQHIDLGERTVIERLQVQPPLRQNPIFQNEACFLHFTEGGTKITTPTESATIHQDESVLLKCGAYFADLFEHKSSGLCEVCVIHFYPDILERIFEEEMELFAKNSSSSTYAKRVSKNQVIDLFVKSLDIYFEEPSLATEEIIYLKIKELVLLLLQTNTTESVRELYSFLFTPRKHQIKNVLEPHLYSNLSVEELAHLAGQSLSTFKRVFKEHYGESPAKYIRNRRLEKAAEYLRQTNLSISEVSFRVGYGDSSYFSKLFQNHFGLLPSDYGKNNP